MVEAPVGFPLPRLEAVSRALKACMPRLSLSGRESAALAPVAEVVARELLRRQVCMEATRTSRSP